MCDTCCKRSGWDKFEAAKTEITYVPTMAKYIVDDQAQPVDGAAELRVLCALLDGGGR
jgi:hypothetical protein